MDRDKKLKEIFDNDPLGLLDVRAPITAARTEEERLVASFQEINDFYEKNNREPELGGGIQEHKLYSRLKAIRESSDKINLLRIFDKYSLLNREQPQITSLEDVLSDDTLGILNDDSEGIFELKNIKRQDERAKADFIARRKPCKDFNKYEPVFKEVQKDLSTGKRKLIPFNEDNLREGTFYVHNGVLFFLERIDVVQQEQAFRSGKRIRKDGRTRCIFENGTESNILYRSIAKVLYTNGKVVTQNINKINEGFVEKFSNVTDEDKESGFIYILKSKSEKKEIKEIHNLYKIGFSKNAVEERIKNASQEPTYLMADVRVVMAYKCYNMNPHKLEQLLHTIFGNVCLSIDVFDGRGNRYTPREWFIVPLEVIEQVVKLIISGEALNYKYDSEHETLVRR